MFKITLKKKTHSEHFYRGEYVARAKTKISLPEEDPEKPLTKVNWDKPSKEGRSSLKWEQGEALRAHTGPATTLMWDPNPLSRPSQQPLLRTLGETEILQVLPEQDRAHLPQLLHLHAEVGCVFL